MKYVVKVSYSVALTYPTLDRAETAMEMLIEGGCNEVTIRVEEEELMKQMEEA